MYINEGLSTHKIAKKENISQSTVRYWLKKFNLKTKGFDKDFKICPRCNEKKDRKDFYSKRNKDGYSTYCKPCTTEQTLERSRNFKIKCVEYKGGKCEKCDYDKCIECLEFHHLDPSEKDFTISKMRTYSFDEKIKKELDKCNLLCRNCHGEAHYMNRKKLINNVERY